MASRSKPERVQIRPKLLMVSGALFALAIALGLVSPSAHPSTAMAQDAGSVLVRLPGVDDPAVYGRVKLIAQDGRTRVVVAIHGVDEGTFMPSIYAGTCAAYPAVPAFPLAPFSVDERSRTTVDIAYDELLSGGYFVDIHPAGASAGDLFGPEGALVCGQIAEVGGEVVEANPTAVPTESGPVVTAPPDTGIGPVSGEYWGTIPGAVLGLCALLFAVAGLDLRRRAALTVAQLRLYRLTGRNP